MKNIEIDMRGKRCPIPVIETKKVLDALQEEAVIRVHVDNETAVQNLRRLAEQSQAGFESSSEAEAHFVAILKAGAGGAAGGDTGREGTVVVFDGDTMGKGSEELGKTLMKGFIYALRELEVLPETCIFYNTGVKLTAEGSESLEDLKALESAGVEILSCGTCAGYFGLEDKIQTGTITNMYTIAEKMAGASRIVKP